MLVKLEDFKHLNGFYRRPVARGVVFKMYKSNCQVCGDKIQTLSDMWVGHRTPRSHREFFDVMAEGRIDIDNLLNLQPEHIKCNRKKSNSYATTPPLFQSALDLAIREVLSVSLESSSQQTLGLDLKFDLGSAVVDGPNADWLWLSLDATDNIVQDAFKSLVANFPGAYLPQSNIAALVLRAASTEAAMMEFDGSLLWRGNRGSELSKYASELWEREKTAWRSSGKPVSLAGQRSGWYIFPHGTDLENLETRVFSPDHKAAFNLQRFSSWIESGHSSKSGSWVCKGEYANEWSSLQNEFHDLVYDHGPIASFEVTKGRAKLNVYSAAVYGGNAARDSFERLFAEDDKFRKGRLEDGTYELFDLKTVRSFVRRKDRRIKTLANAPICQQGAFGTAGPIPF